MIEERIQKRVQSIKKSKKQPIYGLILLLGLIALCYFKIRYYGYGFMIIVGLAMGFIIQRSKICFTASMRDIILFKKTKVFRALLLGMMLATVGFGIKQGIAMQTLKEVPGQIAPVGVHTVLGGILFGIGMVIAGSCVLGTFTRIGEGYLLQLIVLLGLVVGTLLAIYTFGFWLEYCINEGKTIYFGDYISMKGLIPLQITVLGILYWCAYKYEKKK